MRKLSLFSGIGGIDLAAKWAGMETVAFCERESFPQKVLQKHWPNIPIYDDVCKLTREVLERDGIITADRTIDIISAGYPCQPYSIAGERGGSEDDRALWPQVKRILEEIRPNWFVGENVAGHISLGLDGVLFDLDDIGYTTQPFVIPAAAVGAIHRRDRVFIVAYSNSEYVEGSSKGQVQRKFEIQGIIPNGSIEEWTRRSTIYEPKLLRNYNGVSDQVDRLTVLGNAVVPQQVYPILAAIKRIDNLIKGTAHKERYTNG